MSISEIPIQDNLRSDLLDELARMAGCEFLSDLPQPQCRQALCRALREIDPEQFTPRAWKDSAIYLYGTALEFQSARAARDALLAAIEAIS